MSDRLIWFNEDGLNPDLAMLRNYPDARRVYIFDIPYLQVWNISKHRIQFIYESLLEIPEIQIYKGETVPILQKLVARYKLRAIATTETPNHIIKQWQDGVQKFAELEIYPEVFPARELPKRKRFSRYWKKRDRDWLQA
jgi:hypothetical protein